jgi:predicted ABC-type transport system involved in lysophospholipase L1 biosynthesis ATPase subunit
VQLGARLDHLPDELSGGERQRLGSTVLVVTHDLNVAESCPRMIALRDGQVVENRVGQTVFAVCTVK